MKDKKAVFLIKKTEKEALIAQVEKVAAGQPYILHQQSEEGEMLTVTVIASSFSSEQAKMLKEMSDSVKINGGVTEQGKADASMSLFDED